MYSCNVSMIFQFFPQVHKSVSEIELQPDVYSNNTVCFNSKQIKPTIVYLELIHHVRGISQDLMWCIHSLAMNVQIRSFSLTR